MKQVIILGNDHTNSLGVSQCLGMAGYEVTCAVWGNKSGMLKCSNFVKTILSASSVEVCIDKIIEYFGNIDLNLPIPIIACCDTAALVLEKNSYRLKPMFIYEYSTNTSIEYGLQKENQTSLAVKAKFNVPKTWNLKGTKIIPHDIAYPCLIKPLVSLEGAKSDIRVCRDKEELNKNLSSLQFTKNVLLQQYIERDYEISILGCALKNGDVIIPCVENKLTLYPLNVGLECLAEIQPLKDKEIISPIRSLIKFLGYVGVFSVEMMHSKVDNKFYFTEINLRNDGANGFIYKYGVNLPLNHVEDLLDLPLTPPTEPKPGYYIWEMHHTLSFAHRDISIWQWWKEIRKSCGFLTYLKEDKKPFFKQYSNWILSTLRLRKNETYQ